MNGGAVALDAVLTPVSGVSYIPERLYTGQRWDWQAQVYYYGARFYDPRVANFLTEDPARQYSNPYAYVAWKPLSFTDPSGLVFGLGGEFGALSSAFTGLGKNGPDGRLISARDFARNVAARAAGKGFRGGPGGLANATLEQGFRPGASQTAVQVAQMLATQLFGVSFNNMGDEASSNGLTQVSFVTGVNPPEATNPNEAGASALGAVVNAFLKQQGLNSIAAEAALKNAAKGYVGGILNRPGQPFMAVISYIPAQVHDSEMISEQPLAITFPASTSFEAPGVAGKTVTLTGTNFGSTGPFIYGAPASSPSQFGLSAAIIIGIGDLYLQ